MLRTEIAVSGVSNEEQEKTGKAKVSVCGGGGVLQNQIECHSPFLLHLQEKRIELFSLQETGCPHARAQCLGKRAHFSAALQVGVEAWQVQQSHLQHA